MKHLLIILPLLFSKPLLGCCFGPEPFETEYKEAQLVVAGKVTSRKIIRKHILEANGDSYTITYLQYTIKPCKVYKGNPAKKVKVITAHKGTTGGMRFKMWQYYVMYGFQDNKLGLTTSRCNRNFSHKSERYNKEIALLESVRDN